MEGAGRCPVGCGGWSGIGPGWPAGRRARCLGRMPLSQLRCCAVGGRNRCWCCPSIIRGGRAYRRLTPTIIWAAGWPAGGDGWSGMSAALIELMDRLNIAAMVNLDGRWGSESGRQPGPLRPCPPGAIRHVLPRRLGRAAGCGPRSDALPVPCAVRRSRVRGGSRCGRTWACMYAMPAIGLCCWTTRGWASCGRPPPS